MKKQVKREPCPVHGRAHNTKHSGTDYIKCLVHAIDELLAYAKEVSK
jgi:hypothetical protein